MFVYLARSTDVELLNLQGCAKHFPQTEEKSITKNNKENNKT